MSGSVSGEGNEGGRLFCSRRRPSPRRGGAVARQPARRCWSPAATSRSTPLRRAGGGRRPGRLRGGARGGKARRRRDAAGALQPPGRALDRRAGHLDRPDDRLGGHGTSSAASPRRCWTGCRRRVAGPPREDWGSRDPPRPATGASAPRPSTASSAGRRPSIPEWMKAASQEMLLEPACAGVPRLGRDADRRGRARRRRACSKASRAAAPSWPRWWWTPPATATCSPGAGAAFDTDIEEARHPPLHEHRLDVRRRRHARASSRFRPERAGRIRRSSWRWAASEWASSRRPFVSWRDDVALFMGPRLAGLSALDVEDMSEVEIRSHRLMVEHLAFFRARRRASPTRS